MSKNCVGELWWPVQEAPRAGLSSWALGVTEQVALPRDGSQHCWVCWRGLGLSVMLEIVSLNSVRSHCGLICLHPGARTVLNTTFLLRTARAASFCTCAGGCRGSRCRLGSLPTCPKGKGCQGRSEAYTASFCLFGTVPQDSICP